MIIENEAKNNQKSEAMQDIYAHAQTLEKKLQQQQFWLSCNL